MYLILWVIIPVLWSTSAFGADQILGTSPFQGPNGTGMFPLGQDVNTGALFNKDGVAISPLALVRNVNNTLELNQESYDANKPIYVSTMLAIEYMCLFSVFAASLMHGFLWYGNDIIHRFNTAVRDLDSNDIHAQLMVKQESQTKI